MFLEENTESSRFNLGLRKAFLMDSESKSHERLINSTTLKKNKSLHAKKQGSFHQQSQKINSKQENICHSQYGPKT